MVNGHHDRSLDSRGEIEWPNFCLVALHKSDSFARNIQTFHISVKV